MFLFLSRSTALLLTTSFFLVLAGCTHTKVFNTNSPNARADINQRAEQTSATIIVSNRRRIETESLHIAPDVVTWIDPVSGEMGASPTSDLTSVRFRSGGRGALEGLGLGFAAGAVTGALILGIAVATDDYSGSGSGGLGGVNISMEGAVAGGALLGAIPGSVIGLIIGWSSGSSSVYTVTQWRGTGY